MKGGNKMINEIYQSSEKIVNSYLNLVIDFPEKVNVTSDESLEVFMSELGNDINLNDRQMKYKERNNEVSRRQKDFFETYSHEEIILLYNAYEYGKELNFNNDHYLAEKLLNNAKGKEEYFEIFYKSIQREISDLNKNEIIYELAGKQDWIIKDSLQSYLENFA